MFRFFIPGPLPGLNDVISWAGQRLNWLEKRAKKRVYKLTIEKEKWDLRVEACFIMAYHEAGGRGEPKPYEGPVAIQCTWIEPDNRRDPDNVFAGVKFILDGLVKAGALENDTRACIIGVDHFFGDNNPDRPGVFVEIVASEPII